MKARSWTRQSHRNVAMATVGHFSEPKPFAAFHDLGMELVTGEPAYDNGRYFVVDTVRDLEWAVVSDSGARMAVFCMGEAKYEAIRFADDLAESDMRREQG